MIIIKEATTKSINIHHEYEEQSVGYIYIYIHTL